MSAASAHATVFTLDHIDVQAHTDDTDGLQVIINNMITSPLTFDLSAPGANPSTFALFNIWTPESTVNYGEDTVPQAIEVDFSFSAPTPISADPATGDTTGWINGFVVPFVGWFIPTGGQGGTLTWDSSTFDVHFGPGLTGLMTISLNGGDFNDGWLGTDEGNLTSTGQCPTSRHGPPPVCYTPESKGLTVYGSFDWINDPTPTGGVPEPATWALMIGGFGMAGAMMRRRRAASAA